MAVVEFIVHQPMKYDPTSKDSVFGFTTKENLKVTNDFPTIFWRDFLPWKEANQYAFSRYFDSKKSLKTVTREAIHLGIYADWLEQNNLDWLHFPKTKRERCIYRFRGYLVDCRDGGSIAPSTASQIMNALIRFYRWVSAGGVIEKNYDQWEDKVAKLIFFNKEGFERTVDRKTTDLAIHNRRRGPGGVEDGLFPLITAQVEKLMAHLREQSNYEFYLLHKTSLLTGCRFETVATLTIDALRNSYRVADIDNCYYVNVGPGTNVKTKFDVSGAIAFPSFLMDELIAHYESVNSVLRRLNCKVEHHKTIFLTNRGNPYTLQSFSTLMKRLRDELAKKGHTEFKKFKFHQLRATYGTMLMKFVLSTEGVSKANAIEYVKNALLQKDARTAWKYVKFIEQSPVLAEFHELLWQLFTNEKSNSEKIIEELSDRYDG